MPDSIRVVWTDYLRYRANVRGFDLVQIEEILRYGEERYFDHATGRRVVVGRDHGTLVMIPYEIEEDVIQPVTIHATTRQQINSRVRSERFTYE